MTYIADNDTAITGSISTQNLNPASGTATANSSVEILCNAKGACAIQVTGTYTGALSLQGTIDGSAWVTIGMASALKNINTDSFSSNIPSAATGIYVASVGGFYKVRVTALGAVTGTANIALNLSRSLRSLTIDSAIPAGSAILGSVMLQSQANQGATLHSLASAASTNATVVKASTGTLYMIDLENTDALVGLWVKFYDKATTPNPASDVPVARFWVPPTTSPLCGRTIAFGPNGAKFANGISYVVVTGSADNSTVAVTLRQLFMNAVYQ